METEQVRIPESDDNEVEKIEDTNEESKDARAFSQQELEEENAKNRIDVDKFIGKETVIASYEEGTKEFEKGRISNYVKFISDIVDYFPNGAELRATKLMGLQENSEGELGWYPGSKMAVFLERIGAKHYKDAVGKTVKITAIDAKDGNRYLTF